MDLGYSNGMVNSTTGRIITEHWVIFYSHKWILVIAMAWLIVPQVE